VRLHDFFPCFLAWAVLAPGGARAEPLQLQLEERYEWPGSAILRLRGSQDQLVVEGRTELADGHGRITGPQSGHPGSCEESFALGISSPWAVFGPLLPRGILRQVSDPPGFTAGSGLFTERTGFVLDGALPSSRAGVVVTPVRDWYGLFCRPGREGGTETGAFARLSPGGGAILEACAMASRPDARPVPEDWILSRGSPPGGDIANIAGRMSMVSPLFSYSLAAGTSRSAHARPGAFASVWLRGRSGDLDAAALVSGADVGYRAPDGACTPAASRISARVLLGRDRGRGIVESDVSFLVGEPGFSPRREIPTTCAVRAAFSREYSGRGTWPIAILVEADKSISRDPDGVRAETSRCSGTACLSLGAAQCSSGIELSDRGGVCFRGAVGLSPSRQFEIRLEGKAAQLGTPCPEGTASLKFTLEAQGRRASLETGVEDYPLASSVATGRGEPGAHFRLGLSCSARVP